jgi:hypothetical protein
LIISQQQEFMIVIVAAAYFLLHVLLGTARAMKKKEWGKQYLHIYITTRQTERQWRRNRTRKVKIQPTVSQ